MEKLTNKHVTNLSDFCSNFCGDERASSSSLSFWSKERVSSLVSLVLNFSYEKTNAQHQN